MIFPVASGSDIVQRDIPVRRFPPKLSGCTFQVAHPAPAFQEGGEVDLPFLPRIAGYRVGNPGTYSRFKIELIEDRR